MLELNENVSQHFCVLWESQVLKNENRVNAHIQPNGSKQTKTMTATKTKMSKKNVHFKHLIQYKRARVFLCEQCAIHSFHTKFWYGHALIVRLHIRLLFQSYKTSKPIENSRTGAGRNEVEKNAKSHAFASANRAE